MALEIFSNSTHSDKLTWVPNPTTRGTANILVTCLLTLLLCIWKAVHLNLPEYGRPTFCYLEYQTWRKIGWLFTSLIAPELVVYVAWSQLLQARSIANYYNGGLREKKWTLVHGFYAATGGFALETPVVADGEYGMPHSRMVLSRDAIEALIHDINTSSSPTLNAWRLRLPPNDNRALAPDLSTVPDGRSSSSTSDGPSPSMPPEDDGAATPDPTTIADGAGPPEGGRWDPASFLDVSEDEIRDKSKSDGVSKALVCVQACWFCAQCASRIAQGLPVTLLELNTFGHSVCALLIYFIWWHKPADVERSTIWTIRSMKERALWAALSVNMSVREVLPPSNNLASIRNYFRGSTMRYHSSYRIRLDAAENPPASQAIIHSLAAPDAGFQEYPGVALVPAEADGTSYPGVVIRIPSGGLFRPSSREEAFIVWSPYTTLKVVNNNEELDEIGYLPLSVLHGDDWPDVCLGSKSPVAMRPYARLRRRINNWPGFGELTLLSLSSFLLLTALYGGLHCLAWDAHFPSSTDEVMWRASSITLLAGGTPAFLSIFLSRKEVYQYHFPCHDIRPEGGPVNMIQHAILSRPRWLIFLHKVLMRVGRRRFLDKEYRAARQARPAFLNSDGAAYRLTHALFQSTTVLCVALLLAARTFLLVECFIQLAHLPPGPIFTVPNWATYFPHLG